MPTAWRMIQPCAGWWGAGPCTGRSTAVREAWYGYCATNWERIVLIWIAGFCILAGVVLTAAPPIWQGRLSRRLTPSESPGATLEPRRPARGFGLKSNWPGLGLIALGIILFLVAAAM